MYASASAPPALDYTFLLGQLVDTATLARAEALARRWGVLPHAVLIANGWLSAQDYYRALAHDCGVPFRGELGPGDVTAPAPNTTPRQCLASGLLKERTKTGAYVLAPERLEPNALREVLARLAPHRLSLAPPAALRRAVCDEFAQDFAELAVDGLHRRFPEQSARSKLLSWQSLGFAVGAVALAAALALAPMPAIRAVSFALAFLFLPVIALRLVAARHLLRSRGDGVGHPPKRVPEAE